MKNMKSNIMSFAFIILGIFLIAIIGVYADDGNITVDIVNVTNSTNDGYIPDSVEYIDNSSVNLTIEDEDLSFTDEPPEIFSKTVHPNVETDVSRSTPTGNPLIPKYALGSVSIDIGAHIMEGRGSDNNVSSEMTLRDHTSANGYITTIIKDFRYMSGVDL
jgi:hypothetical protein